MPREWDENGNLITEAPVREWDENGKLIASEGSAPRKTLKLEGAKMSAAPQPSGVLATAEKWLGDAASDIREGLDSTVIGRGMKMLGAKGTGYGNSPAIGDYMASPIQGPIRMARGITQIPQGKIIEGAKNIGAGALDTAQIPAAFMGGPAAGKVAGKVDAIIPSAKRSGENFQAVMRGAGHIPIDTTEIQPIVQRAMTLSKRGSAAPQVVRDLDRAGRSGPIMYEAGRDFASNAGKLSAAEKMATKGDMGRQVSLLARALDTANEGAAEAAGLGDAYRSAMKEYRQAQQLKSGLKTAAKIGAGGAAAALGGGWAIHAARTALGL